MGGSCFRLSFHDLRPGNNDNGNTLCPRLSLIRSLSTKIRMIARWKYDRNPRQLAADRCRPPMTQNPLASQILLPIIGLPISTQPAS